MREVVVADCGFYYGSVEKNRVEVFGADLAVGSNKPGFGDEVALFHRNGAVGF